MMMRSLLLLLLTVLVGPLAAQGGTPDPQDAVREYRRYFAKYKLEKEQVEAVLTLKGNECKEALDELVKLLSHKSQLVQKAALEVIETYQDPATYQDVIAGLPQLKDQGMKATLFLVFGQAKVAAAAPAITAAMADGKATPAMKYEAARALARIGGDIVGAIGPLLADADGLVRVAAADAVAAQKLTALSAPVTKLLADPEWQVQSAAIAAVGIVRPQDAVQPLIDLLRKGGRLQIECSDSLFKVTGLDFGLDADAWQKQWDRLMTIQGWRIPTDEELAKKAESRKKYDALYGKTDKVNTFAKIPTTSTRVLFIIDVSGSMDELVIEQDKFQGYADLKKFTVVRTELLNAIDTLTQDTHFDIVAFATDLDVWKRRLVPANIVNRDAAKSWIRRLQPIGGTESQEAAAIGLGSASDLTAGKTNTLKALLYSFGMDGDKPPKGPLTGGDHAAIKSELDTVYFLSDGRPSVGRLVETQPILEEVLRVNASFKIVFHTIAIGQFQKEFLRALAEQTGGVYVDLGR